MTKVTSIHDTEDVKETKVLNKKEFCKEVTGMYLGLFCSKC
jgi:hypothetical protein